MTELLILFCLCCTGYCAYQGGLAFPAQPKPQTRQIGKSLLFPNPRVLFPGDVLNVQYTAKEPMQVRGIDLI